MKTLKLEILDPRAMRPCGSPFGVKCIEVLDYGIPHIKIVKTGIRVELPDDMTLTVVAIVEGLTVMGWCMQKEGLEVTIIFNDRFVGFKDEPFAQAFVVDKKPVPVRFVEFSPEGKRVICGSPEAATGEKDG